MHHLVYRNLTLLFIVFLLTLKVTATPSEYHISHFTNENGLPQNSIRGVELDKEGFVWLATEAGLVRFDGQYFKLYDRDHYPLLQSNRITHLSLDTTGTICFRDEFYNAYTFDRKGRLLSIPKQAYKARAIFFSKSQFLLLSDTLHYRNTKWEMTLPVPSYHSKLGRWGQLNYNCYYKDKWGEIWCVDTARNVKKVRITGLLTHLRSFTKTNQSYSLYPHGNELYLHAGKGIYRLSEGLSGVLKATLVLETDVPEIQFYRNYPDLNLQLIGTQTQGVYIFRRKQFTTLRHDNKNSNYYPQVPLGDSGVLTDRGPVYPSFARPDYPFKNAITYRSLLRDKLRRYWINKSINNRNDKIVLLDSQLRVLKTLITIYTANCFRETPDGHIWMCSFQGDRMGYAHNDSVQWLPALWGHDTSALTFLPIDNETFWIGGMHIFAKFNVKSRQLLHFKSLEGYIIETLYLDKQNIIWIGTSGNGFYALKQGKIYAFPLDKNAGLKNVHTFMEDKTGFMWMTTNNGLFRCKRKDLDNFLAGKVKDIYYQCFKKESGFNTNEFNGSCTPSGIVLGNGKFSLPSIDGLVQFYPDSIREPLSDKKIFIDKFLVDGKEKDLANFIELQPSFQRIEIEVASPILDCTIIKNWNAM
jgi:ligand-binding sensor domain-containing protein